MQSLWFILLLSVICTTYSQINFGIPPLLRPQGSANGRLPIPSAPSLSSFPANVNKIANIPSKVISKVEKLLEEQWGDFKNSFKKVYSSVEEETFRKEVFIENRAKILKFDKDYADGIKGFVQKLNPFADLLNHEFNQLLNGFNRTQPNGAPKPQSKASTFLPSANAILPESVDWRKVGAVREVKSQGQCAGCYAFAAAGALEAHWFRKTGQLVEVSVQNLIDCTQPQGNFGCAGGLMDPAFQYIKDNDGVDSEPSYPFEEKNGQCRFTKENVVATCTGYVDIPSGDEKALENAVATIGPVTAAIDAGHETFQFYSEGVYDEPECGNKPEQMNHAVLIVGYGQEPNGKKYWLVKNSYGTEWGIGGYVKIAKDNGNQCGIAIQASYPLVEKTNSTSTEKTTKST